MSVSDDEQERRFQQRVMMEYTDIPEARWYQIDADDPDSYRQVADEINRSRAQVSTRNVSSMQSARPVSRERCQGCRERAKSPAREQRETAAAKRTRRRR